MIKLLAGTGVAALAVLAAPAISYASSGSAPCTVVHDHITKTDSGHGSPAEWADLSMNRVTTICGSAAKGYTVHLVDTGALWTRTGAGTPNGTGGQISDRVKGAVHGVYDLTVSGGALAHKHGDVSLSSTEYVRSLFTPGATVTGHDYKWTYSTGCGEKWVDGSANNDGQGADAGNITGKTCTPTPTPTPTDTTPAPAPSDSTPAPSPSTTTPGEAPAPTPVKSDLPVTG